MYYCLVCRELHPHSKGSAKLFVTGFHTYPNQDQYPLGICRSSEHELSLYSKPQELATQSATSSYQR